MRIPYEGMLAAEALAGIKDRPLLVSVWGNDFTLHAASNTYLASATNRTLQRANGLHADCQRDIRLGRAWGYSEDKPVWVLPGGGGIHLDVFYPNSNSAGPGEFVINPRGSGHIFATIRSSRPSRSYCKDGLKFDLCVPIWRTRAWQSIGSVRLESPARSSFSRACGHQMADWFRRCRVVVSPSTHDGTPNTLLEGMACGCFPIAGDINPCGNGLFPA